MITKLLEIRDRATFLPMFATLCEAINPDQRYLLRRAGYGDSPRLVLFGYLEGRGSCFYDPYNWNDRTKQTAHLYIQENWDKLKDGDVVDVEFILGESKQSKISERLEVTALDLAV